MEILTTNFIKNKQIKISSYIIWSVEFIWQADRYVELFINSSMKVERNSFSECPKLIYRPY